MSTYGHVYPPGFVGPVIGYRCRTESEWAATTLSSGDRCWFRYRRKWREGRELTPWKVGTFLYAWHYDGVIAKVYEDDPDDYIEHSIFCDMGDEIRATPP